MPGRFQVHKAKAIKSAKKAAKLRRAKASASAEHKKKARKSASRNVTRHRVPWKIPDEDRRPPARLSGLFWYNDPRFRATADLPHGPQ